ncbi:rhomboid family intramembrane serine protease [Planctomycetota bacterium]|nr:rhomboid family intramembrane serine protease [Planctomycetota bacterium]
MARILKFNPGSQPQYAIGLLIVIGIVSVADLATNEMITRLFAGRGIDIQYGQYWRLLTLGFVHSGFLHLAFNCYGLWLLGGMYERLAGGKWMLGVFVIAVLASGGAGALVYDAHATMVGASGGVYGLFAAVLAYYYTKTGSIQGMFRVPQSRLLLIWLGFGIFMSIRMPGVSLVGHLAGFVPGAVLGYYYELWYSRRAEFYHKASAVAVVAMTVLVCAYACYPIGRASLSAVQAMKAYEDGDMERGDDLRKQAADGKRKDDGTMALMRHLKLWREHAFGKKSNDMEALTWPLLHAKGVNGKSEIPYGFVSEDDLGIPRVTVDDTPSDVEDAGREGEIHGNE